MRNAFQTKFWRNAYDSLPNNAKRRHIAHMIAAEQWELGLDQAIEGWSRLKSLFAVGRVQPH